jgi:hypothetical protein
LNKIITQARPLVLDELEVILPPQALDAGAVQPRLDSNVDWVRQEGPVLISSADRNSAVSVAPRSQVGLWNEMVPFWNIPRGHPSILRTMTR